MFHIDVFPYLFGGKIERLCVNYTLKMIKKYFK